MVFGANKRNPRPNLDQAFLMHATLIAQHFFLKVAYWVLGAPMCMIFGGRKKSENMIETHVDMGMQNSTHIDNEISIIFKDVIGDFKEGKSRKEQIQTLLVFC